MVTITPFTRLLKEIAELANRDASAAFARLEEAYGKSCTPADVLQLGTFAAHLGGSTLGRFEDTAALLEQLVEHPATVLDANVARSLWRALAVMFRCSGRKADADHAAQQGCAAPGDECRLALMTGNTLALRGRAAEALPYLDEATKAVSQLTASDDAVAMCATVTGQILQLAEQQAQLSHALLLSAGAAHQAAWNLHPDWRGRHRAWFQTGQTRLVAGEPGGALAAVQAMMDLEDAHSASPLERFFTAALAARAQTMRGQDRLARGALEACQDFAKRIEPETQREAISPLLMDLERLVK